MPSEIPLYGFLRSAAVASSSTVGLLLIDLLPIAGGLNLFCEVAVRRAQFVEVVDPAISNESRKGVHAIRHLHVAPFDLSAAVAAKEGRSHDVHRVLVRDRHDPLDVGLRQQHAE